MTTYSLISCCEEHGKQSETWSKDSLTAQVTLRCAWASRAALMADVVSNRRAWPTNASMLATSASCVPAPTAYLADGQGIAYIDALVTVNYSTNEEEDLVSESLEPTAEFLTLDYHRFRWAAANGDPLLEGEAPGKLLRSLSLSRTLYKIASPLPAELLTKIGYVNNTAYSSALLGLTFPKATLLYQPPTMSRTITTSGTKGWDINLKFMYKPETWNKFWRSKTQTWEKVFLADAGTEYKSYPEGSFSTLLF